MSRPSTLAALSIVGTVMLPPAGAAQGTVTSLPCESSSGGVETRGTVADLLSRAPLPGAVVSLEVPGTFPVDIRALAESDVDGRFVFCARSELPGSWTLRAELDTLASRPVRLEERSEGDTLYIRWSEPATLSGWVRRVDGGQAVAGARVQLEGRAIRATTDDEGAFRLRGVGAGHVVVTTTALGLATRSDSVFLPTGGSLSVDIRVSAEPIELPPLTVSVAPRDAGEVGRFVGVTRGRIEELLPRAADLAMLLDLGNTPGLSTRPDPRPGGVCIEFMRRAGTSCSMVAVFVNGVLMADGSGSLSTIPLTAIEEIRIYPPAEAQFRFFAPNIRNGAIDIVLR